MNLVSDCGEIRVLSIGDKLSNSLGEFADRQRFSDEPGA
jgi:hypothetical protein